MLTLWNFFGKTKKTREEFKEIWKDNYIYSQLSCLLCLQRFDHFCQIFVEGSLELKTVHLNPSPAIVESEEPDICSL